MDAQGGGPVVGVADHYRKLVELFRARSEFLNLTYASLDDLCGFPQGYVATLMCGTKAMSVFSLFTLARALALLPTFAHDEAQLANLKRHADWIESKRKGPKWRPRVLTTGRHRVVEIKLYPDLLRKRALLGVAARMVKLSEKRRSAIARKAALARWRRANLNGASPDRA